MFSLVMDLLTERRQSSFKKHEKSQLHKEAAMKVALLQQHSVAT